MDQQWRELSGHLKLEICLKEAINSPFETISQLCSVISEDGGIQNEADYNSTLSLLNILVECGSPKEIFLSLLDELSKFQHFDIVRSLLPLITKTLLRLPKKESTLASWKLAISTIYPSVASGFERLRESECSEKVFNKINSFLNFVSPLIIELKTLGEYRSVSRSVNCQRHKLQSALVDRLLNLLTLLYEYHGDIKLMSHCVYSAKIVNNLLTLEPDVIKCNTNLIERWDKTNAKLKSKKRRILKDFNGSLENTINDNETDFSDEELENNEYSDAKLFGLMVFNRFCSSSYFKVLAVYSHDFQLKSILPILGRLSYRNNTSHSDWSIQIQILVVDFIYSAMRKCSGDSGLYADCFKDDLIKPVIQFMIASQSKELTQLCTQVISHTFKLVSSDDKVVLYTYIMYTFDHVGVKSFAVQCIKDELAQFFIGKSQFSEAQCISLLKLCFKNSTSQNVGNFQGHGPNEESLNMGKSLTHSEKGNSIPLLDSAGLHLSRLNLLRFILLLKQRAVNSMSSEIHSHQEIEPSRQPLEQKLQQPSDNSVENQTSTQSISLLIDSDFINVLDQTCSSYLKTVRSDATVASLRLTSELNSLNVNIAGGNKGDTGNGLGNDFGMNGGVNGGNVSGNRGLDEGKIGDGVATSPTKYCEDKGILDVGLGVVSDSDWAEVLISKLNQLDLLVCVLARVEELNTAI